MIPRRRPNARNIQLPLLLLLLLPHPRPKILEHRFAPRGRKHHEPGHRRNVVGHGLERRGEEGREGRIDGRGVDRQLGNRDTFVGRESRGGQGRGDDVAALVADEEEEGQAALLGRSAVIVERACGSSSSSSSSSSAAHGSVCRRRRYRGVVVMVL